MTALVLAPMARARARSFCASTRLGASGMWHVPTASLCERRLLSFSVTGSFADTSGLTVPTDTYRQWSYGLHGTWTITPAWQVGIGVQGAGAELMLPGRTQTRSTSVTELFGRYAFELWDRLGGAAMLQVATPGAAAPNEASDAYALGSFSAVPWASTITPRLSLTWQAALDATLSLGYAFDNSGALLRAPATAEQAAGLNIAAGNRVLLQLALAHDFTTRIPWLAATPFLELSTTMPGGTGVKHTSAMLTAGGKAFFGAARFFEVTGGVDIGLAGLAPAPTDIPTVPTVQVFLQAVVNLERLGELAPPCAKAVCPAAPPPAPASTPEPTPAKSVRVIHAHDPNHAAAPLTLRGIVRDDQTGEPIVAKIFLPEGGTVIRCDTDGSFSTNLPEGHLEVIVSSPGYVTQKHALEGEDGDIIILNVDLRQKRKHHRNVDVPEPVLAPTPQQPAEQQTAPPEQP